MGRLQVEGQRFLSQLGLYLPQIGHALQKIDKVA
uniref:Uncharacterized protein n=1 Tax=Rhizophora mucronata TaxID=61149 RepID=A0A2P2MFJ8_RHIMU